MTNSISGHFFLKILIHTLDDVHLALSRCRLSGNEYADVKGCCEMVSPYSSMYFFLLCFHKTSIPVSFFPVLLQCLHTVRGHIPRSQCSVVSVYNNRPHKIKGLTVSNSLSGMHHLIRLLYMIKHRVMNIQAWKFSVSH